MERPLTIVWFRNDFRLADHAALSAAVAEGGAVVPVYVHSDGGDRKWLPGGASRWWLGESLRALDRELRARGSQLVVRRGDEAPELERLIGETGARRICWNRRYEPALAAADLGIQAGLARSGVAVEMFGGALLFGPDELCTKDGRPFQVFTPFWKAAQARLVHVEPRPEPKRIPGPSSWPKSLAIGELELDPQPDWAGGLRAAWRPGEAGARKRLTEFVARELELYELDRNRPDLPGSSRLSPPLHFGEVTPRQIVDACRTAASRKETISAAADAYVREIGWREFAYHLLHHFPHTTEAPLRREFERVPWSDNKEHLRAWQKGLTGYPIVDAGMRELWATGWMHNRVRMIAASFLVKDLLIPWQEGAKWFWDTLVDADLANNTLGWQWTAGCGADAAPYFRIFNPVTQGEKFDPEGMYVRRWVPELAGLPNEYVHKPWEAPPMITSAAKVTLGQTYPSPIVDHAAARKRALAAFERIKSKRP